LPGINRDAMLDSPLRTCAVPGTQQWYREGFAGSAVFRSSVSLRHPQVI